MRANSQFSVVLHLLLHLAAEERPVTSEMLAKATGSNAVVIRRMMAGLRTSGFVQSQKGHHGGWTLTRGLSEITLRDVYTALGQPALFAIQHRLDNPDCAVEQAVNGVLDGALADVTERLLTLFEDVSLADVEAKVHRRAPVICDLQEAAS